MPCRSPYSPAVDSTGRSRIPAGFEWSLPSLAAYVAHVMDKAGVDSAHIIGAKAGGAIAMQFAADYPARTRTLSVVHVPVVTSSAAARFSVLNPKEQGARLGSAASKEMVCLRRDECSIARQRRGLIFQQLSVGLFGRFSEHPRGRGALGRPPHRPRTSRGCLRPVDRAPQGRPR
jgi:pimeloyl-ACP methyl ester carboxylesterase